MEERFNDRLARYSFMYRLRTTTKEKKRFLKALVVDIAQNREDISVIEYAHKRKYHAQNVYVGNLKKADTIICTYYDTPPVSFGDYVFFDREKQRKQTTQAVVLFTLLWLGIGVLGTLGYMAIAPETFTLLSLQTLVVAIIYIVYFFLLARISKGGINRQSVIRNTSSILCLLELLSNQKKQDKVAYAFLDEGCYGERGLDALKSSIKKGAKIYVLDCIGADAPMVACERNKIHYLFCALQNENHEYYLKKETLKAKCLNVENIKEAIKRLQHEGE